jgi:hypothetical protein
MVAAGFYKCVKTGCEEPLWVNPNKDGTYTSPGEGWKEFVPRFEGDTLRILSGDGTTAYHFGENRDGSPRAFSLQTGMVLDSSWDIVGLFIPGKLTIKSLEFAAVRLWAKNLAERAAVSTLEDLLKNAVKDRVSKSIQYIKTGGMRQANKDFEELVGKSGTTNRGGGLRTATLADGTKVNVRPFSSGGKPTLEIKPPTGKTVKIRYE